MTRRCGWCGNNPLYIAYHDNEWGVPVHDDHKLFEMLILEGAQAGLSWLTILQKRDHYRRAFDQFDPQKIARYGEADITRLLQDAGIVRNRLKVEAAIKNARAYLDITAKFESFSAYLWQFVNHKPIINRWQQITDIPPQSPESEDLSNDLKKRGCNFVGPTICYAFMQAVGMVNDHILECDRHAEINRIN